MKAEYKEGPEARENFERARTKIFQAPKKAGKQPKKATVGAFCDLFLRKASYFSGRATGIKPRVLCLKTVQFLDRLALKKVVKNSCSGSGLRRTPGAWAR